MLTSIGDNHLVMKRVRIDAQATSLLDECEYNALRGERVFSTGRDEDELRCT